MSPRLLSFIRSRNTLLSISKDKYQLEKYRLFDMLLENIWRKFFKEIPGSGKTRIILDEKYINGFGIDNRLFFNNGWFIESIQIEFMEVLKKEFHDCTISYIETKGYEEKIIERLLIIDWS